MAGIGNPLPRVWFCALFVGFAALALATRQAPGATQYDVVQLDPSAGVAYGIDHGVAAGYDHTGKPTAWSNNGTTVTHLPVPSGYSGAVPLAISGDQEAGWGTNTTDGHGHALLWNGLNSIPVDLGAFSQVNAIYNGIQAGGDDAGNAAVWRGTAASHVSLRPSGATFLSEATGIWGNEVSGTWHRDPTGSDPHAAVWTSLSPSGFVDLTQPSFIKSNALAVSRGQVAGWAIIVNAGKHAGIWTNTAAGFQDLAPAGTTASELWGTNGTQQVGDVSLLPGGGSLPVDSHAAVWNGTASSYQMLPSPGYNYSIAFAIDGNGDIVGEVGTQRLGTIGNIAPAMWIPHRLPGDANFDGVVNFSDLLILSQHYGQPGEWVDGEFSGGGTVNFADLLTLAQNYGKTQSADQLYAATSLSSNPLPEPADIVLLSIGWASMLRYRGLGAAQA